MSATIFLNILCINATFFINNKKDNASLFLNNRRGSASLFLNNRCDSGSMLQFPIDVRCVHNRFEPPMDVKSNLCSFHFVKRLTIIDLWDLDEIHYDTMKKFNTREKQKGWNTCEKIDFLIIII